MPEAVELRDLLERMGRPITVTLDEMITRAGPPPEVGIDGNFVWTTPDPHSLAAALKDRRNRRMIGRWMQECRYVSLVNPRNKEGIWKVDGKRQNLYGNIERNINELMEEARRRSFDGGGSGGRSEQ